MANGRSFGALFLGVLIGYLVWGNEPSYIENVKSNEENALVLESTGFTIKDRYQVAVIHGFIGNEEICNKLAKQFEREDGIVYHCVPALGVTARKPWWNFW